MQGSLQPNQPSVPESFARAEKLVLVLEGERTQIRIVGAGEDMEILFSLGLAGRLLDEVIPAELSELLLKTVCQVLAEGREQRVEYSLTVGGIPLEFVGRVFPLSPDSVLWLARNTAAMKFAGLPVLHQLELTKAIIACLGEGVCAVDLHGRLLFMNPAAQDLLGWTEAELSDRDLHEILHGPAKSGARYSPANCPVCDAIRREYSVGLDEALFVHKNGCSIPVALTVSPIVREGHCEGGVITFRDNRSRIALEEKLSHAHKLEAVGQLAGGVAHDFNNLLTVINGYASMLLEREDCRGSVRESLNEIAHAGDRAAVLTQRLLAFSRRQVLNPQIVELNAIITGLQPMLRRLIREDIVLEIRLCGENTQVMADPDQLEQVIVNLALNARDAMPGGGNLILETSIEDMDELRAKCQPGGAGGLHIRLTVKDTGGGMSPEVQARVFEPFFTTKDPGKGTGLGLSMAYGAIRQSGGHIGVESAPGAGTTMTVLLPRVAAAPPFEQAKRPASGVSRGAGTILLVEDDEAVREFAREVLLRSGYRVLTAANGPDALHLATRYDGAIDLLLSDVVMPGINGPEVARAFLDRRRSAAVLFMSGYVDDSTLREHDLSPDAEILQKPFSAPALLESVHRQITCPGATILIADDQPAIRTLLRNTLAPYGYHIVEASDGRQILAICRSTQVDLIITDLAMPEEDGLEAIPELRQEFPAIHIVAMSGIIQSDDLLQMAHFLGAEVSLAKPLNLASIPEIVKSMLMKGPRGNVETERQHAHA